MATQDTLQKFLGAPLESLVNVTDAGTRAAITDRLNSWRTSELMQYRATFPQGGEEALADYQKFLDGHVAVYTKLADGRAKLEDVKNAVESFQMLSAQRLIGTNPKVFGYLSGIQQLAPGLYNTTSLDLLKSKLGIDAKNAFNVFTMANVDKLPLYSPYNNSKDIEGAQELSRMYMDEIDNQKAPDAQQTDEFFSQVNTVINGLETGTPNNEQYYKAFDIVGSVDWPKWKKLNPNKASEVEDKLAEVVDAYAMKAGRSLTGWANSDKDMASKLEFIIGPSQRIQIAAKSGLSAGDKTQAAVKAKELNSMYNFGTVSRAWAVIYNKPQVDLLKKLAQSGYFPSAIGFAGAGDRNETP